MSAHTPMDRHPLPQVRHFTTTEWGHFFDETNTLIGHYSTDVMEFLAAHPDYRGHIMFDYGTGDGQTDVTEVFFPEEDDEDGSFVRSHRL